MENFISCEIQVLLAQSKYKIRIKPCFHDLSFYNILNMSVLTALATKIIFCHGLELQIRPILPRKTCKQ